MKVTLHGENSFSLKTELDKHIAAFVGEYGEFGLERLDGEEVTYERLQEALQSLPFLVSKKLVILNSPSKNKQYSEKVEQLLGNLPESTDVILIEPKLDKRFAYYKYLKLKTDFRDFPELDQPAMTRWLTAEAKARGGSISTSDASYLIDRVGLNQRKLSNELDKLLLYDSKVTHHNIVLLTDETPQSTIFQLLDAAFAGNVKRAFELYDEQRRLKVEPAQIIAMLTWQLHIMALLKSAGNRSPDQIAREAKLNPYVVRKSSSLVSRLSFVELKELISELLDIDIRLKREPIDPDEALEHYLLRVSKR